MSREIDNIQRLIENKNVQFRDFRLTNIEERDGEESSSLIVRGSPIVYNEETILYKSKYVEYREKISPNALDNADASDVIFNYNHGGRVYARTRNGTLALENKPKRLDIVATLRGDDRGHNEFYNDIKSGILDKMSFAFTVKRSSLVITEQENDVTIYTRTIEEIDKLFDVSAVDIPAYDATSISARRAFEAESLKLQAESRSLFNERARKKLLLKLEVNL